jgi:AraC-like DNA-binding protein
LKITELLLSWAERHQEKQIQVLPYAEEINNCVVFINENLSSPLKISDLAKNYGLSESTFYRAFTSIVGVSPKQYIIQQRLTTAAFLLKITTRTIQSIAYDVGYYSEFQFSRDFKKKYSSSPSVFRNQSSKQDKTQN